MTPALGSGSRRTLVLGSGLLGSAVAAALGHPVAPDRPIRWGRAQANSDVAGAVGSFLEAVHPDGKWGIAWCAGAGFVGASPEAMAAEVAAFEAMCEVAERAHRPGKIVMASSAGAVYAGCGSSMIDELTDPISVSAYGDARLAQEHRAAALAGRTASEVLIARISNLYGANQRLDKPQGAISHLLRSLLLRRPFVLTVPIDTQRDYIDAETAGRRIAVWMDRDDRAAEFADAESASASGSGALAAGTVTTKLIVSGRAESLARLAAVAHTVSGVRPRIVSTVNFQSSVQPRSLRFVSKVDTAIDVAVPARSLEEGVGQLWRRMLEQYSRSGPTALGA